MKPAKPNFLDDDIPVLDALIIWPLVGLLVAIAVMFISAAMH